MRVAGGSVVAALLLVVGLGILVYVQHSATMPSEPVAPANVGAGPTQAPSGELEPTPDATLPAYAIDRNTGEAIWLTPGGLAAHGTPAATSSDILCPDGLECPPSK